ncbi:N-acetyl-gamma-glutamyl-phosphate reductase [Luteimonas marina]|uniref:N-acetyl-gamma-glutamyl-phosphate reductase n=1 Tax=Luteimonas marina TaxID=488485 RepID=A0A5C5UCR0_9GAMM|nr:N-acetyl-gamma-glutamyl-phosphate reductase [Luteimonas marina]TWT23350.1 N-acetyl-gamma-glutamyl-phosphate reductase [Luteimonas marina]
MSKAPVSLGIVGARGHTGSELIRLVAAHPRFELAFVSSRELDGQRVAGHSDAYTGDLCFENLDADAVAAKGADAVVLALPNGKAAPYVAALDAAKPDTVIVDLSADHRFDEHWYYGLPELTRARYEGSKRISNPGCYATAMELAIAPVLDRLAGPPQCFGVSGYSGAGTTPSDKNNVELLRDNLMPYALAEHMHEREVSRHLGVPVEFMPHVAPHFRGITMTVNLWLQQPVKVEDVRALYRDRYAGEPLLRVGDDAPWVSRIAGRHGVEIGGFTVAPGGKRLVVVSTLDNLLKGAATQAMQNLNLAFGFDELAGIPADAFLSQEDGR